MRTPSALPPILRGQAFTVADARCLGMPRGRLHRSDLIRPHRGVRLDQPPETLEERCAAYLPVMASGFVFSHGTAAQLHGIPVPRSIEADARLHVSAPTPRQPPRARGIVGHQLTERSGFLTRLHGLPVTSAAETWCLLGHGLNVPALVAAGDFLLRHGVDRPDERRRDLIETMTEVRRLGSERLEFAEWLLRPGTRSPMESLLRVALVLARLPEPEVNRRIVGANGTFVGEGDLVYVEARLVIEYEGDVHRTDEQQFRRDIRRRERFEDAGWGVLRVTADDVFVHTAELVDRVASRIGVHPVPIDTIRPRTLTERYIE